jgi:hypothetical protein
MLCVVSWEVAACSGALDTFIHTITAEVYLEAMDTRFRVTHNALVMGLNPPLTRSNPKFLKIECQPAPPENLNK